MRRLPFERTYLLESAPCPRCAGSGRYPHPTPNLPPDCLNCRGLGRKISRAGREVFAAIAAALGKPVRVRESRIDPKHLNEILGADVAIGMRIRELGARRPRRSVASVEPLTASAIRIAFADGTRTNASPLTTFSRELTPLELDRAEAILADHLGRGAMRADDYGD